MRRLLIIVAGVIAIGAAGVAGLWYMNRGAAEDQIVAALDEARAAGVDVQYEQLSIQGFPFAYQGVFQSVVVQNRRSGVAVTLPTASAEVSLSALDTVVFELPAEATLSALDADGAAVGAPVKVTTENATVSITPGGPDEYDFAFQSGVLRLAPDVEGAIDYLEIAAPKSAGRLSIDRAAGAGELRGDLSAAGVDARFQGAGPRGEPNEGSLKMGALSASIVGGLTEMSVDSTYESLDMTVQNVATMTARDVKSTMKALPEDGKTLAIGELFQEKPTPETAEKVLAAIVAGVAGGGAFDSSVSFAEFKFDVAPPPEADAQGMKLSFEAADFAYGVRANPEEMGLTLDAAKLIYDFSTPDAGQGGAPGAMSYDVDGMKAVLKADAAERFNLLPALAAPNEDEAVKAFFLAIRDQIVAGGSAELAFSVDSGSSVVSFQDPSLPFNSVASASGPQITALKLTADEATFDTKAEAITYELAGGVAGKIAMQEFSMDLATPLKRSDEPQSATLDYDMNTITIDDGLWAFVDPQGDLNRDIRGLRISLSSEVTVFKDILALDEEDLQGPPPIAPGLVKVDQALLELLGLKVEATGEVDPRMTPPTADLEVVLTDWRAFFESVLATPFGGAQEPSILMATNWLETYGVEGSAPNVTVLDVTFDGVRSIINGKPFPPEPEPAPAPEGETAPLQSTPEINEQDIPELLPEPGTPDAGVEELTPEVQPQ